MCYVLIEYIVKDYSAFESVFNYDAARRQRHGSKGMRVFRAVDDPNRVIVLLEWDDADKAAEFAGSLELHEAIEWAGAGVTMPRMAVVEQFAQSPA